MGGVGGGEKEEFPSTFEEWRGNTSSKPTRTAVFTLSPSSSSSAAFSTLRFGSWWSDVRLKILNAFLPEGYPASVTPDYLPFQVWDSLQGLSTYVRSMLSTQALLSAIGVGEKSATVIGATFQWFLRDFTGMLGGILFTFYQGSNLDGNAKMWRLAADFMNDLGMLMDLVSPLFPSVLIPVVCFGSLSRSLTGVASGATRAALTQHFSLENNAADISAKEGSQETIATMIGMILGMLLAHIAREYPLAIWTSFLSLTLFHMYANYRAVCCLCLRTINNERGSLLLQHFMKSHKVLSPNHVSTMEHVLPTWISPWSSYSKKYKSLHKCVKLGTRISSLKHHDMMELLKLTRSHYRNEGYILLERNGKVSVIAHKDTNPANTLKSFFHALAIANLVGRTESLHAEAQEWMDKHYHTFIAKLQSSGWMTERLLTPTIVWRANWDHASSDDKRKNR